MFEQVFKESETFSCESHEECEANDDCPVFETYRHHVKELLSDVDDEYLSDKDHRGNEDKAFASREDEGRLAACETFCVEEVPELEHNEYREEQAQLIIRQAAATIFSQVYKVC